ncbi:MAG TPA: nucleoside deaminase [Gemmatimonadaceae bacterium]|nr:nucleoside deaminase [Gemmatimonadaceae bacterium]
MPAKSLPRIIVEYPDWIGDFVAPDLVLRSDEDRMRLAITLARENVKRGSGGPFGALVVESASGRVVAAGLNSVLRYNNSVLHGEVVAIMMAQHRLGSWTLNAEGMPEHELVTSCEPCAMCLGAVHWSGVRRLVCAATRDDATDTDFDEGPVFPESYRYLEERGVAIVRGVLRDEAHAVLVDYRERGGPVYNA